MGQTESSGQADSSVRYWPGADSAGGAGLWPMALARRLARPGAAAPVAKSTQYDSDSEEVGPVMHEAVNWLAVQGSRGGGGWGAVAPRGREGCVSVHGGAGSAPEDGAAAEMSRRREPARPGLEMEPLQPLLRTELDGGPDPHRHRRRSVPAAIWYAPLDEQQDQREDLLEEEEEDQEDGPAGSAAPPGAAVRRRLGQRRFSRRLSDQVSDGVVPQWLQQLSSWVHLTPGLSRSATGVSVGTPGGSGDRGSRYKG
ncbi:hypothetical protein FJT64_027771 [Amphibalanus amphitrite]|uniref:Uncharacterized protein n=1 Tax=Amphibalanus amphitrite TaxID=1232801 RepID=A0A6A4W6V7_AMPAM|nr:hypothetical protein FJT64_027771 [Amphibalanus amphitrite]